MDIGLAKERANKPLELRLTAGARVSFGRSGVMVSAMDCVMNGGAVAAHLPTITFMPQLFHHEGLDHFHESIGDGARKMDAIVADFLLAHAAFTVEPGD